MSMPWLHSVKCILELDKKQIMYLFGKNRNMQVTNSQNAEGKQLSPSSLKCLTICSQ